MTKASIKVTQTQLIHTLPEPAQALLPSMDSTWVSALEFPGKPYGVPGFRRNWQSYHHIQKDIHTWAHSLSNFTFQGFSSLAFIPFAQSSSLLYPIETQVVELHWQVHLRSFEHLTCLCQSTFSRISDTKCTWSSSEGKSSEG
jgi:hypothetical protein